MIHNLTVVIRLCIMSIATIQQDGLTLAANEWQLSSNRLTLADYVFEHETWGTYWDVIIVICNEYTSWMYIHVYVYMYVYIYIYTYLHMFLFRSAMQLRLSHTSAAACPKRLPTSNGGNDSPTVRSGKFRSGTTLLTSTFYAEPDGMGKLEPIHRKGGENTFTTTKTIVGGVNYKLPTMTECSWAKILIQSYPRRTAGLVTTSLTVRRQIVMNRKA